MLFSHCSIALTLFYFCVHRSAPEQAAFSPAAWQPTNYTTPQDFATEPRQQRAETARGLSNMSTDRSKAVSEIII